MFLRSKSSICCQVVSNAHFVLIRIFKPLYIHNPLHICCMHSSQLNSCHTAILASDSGSDACHGSIVSHFNIPGPALETRSCELNVFVLNKIFMFQNDILINRCSKILLFYSFTKSHEIINIQTQPTNWTLSINRHLKQRDQFDQFSTVSTCTKALNNVNKCIFDTTSEVLNNRSKNMWWNC